METKIIIKITLILFILTESSLSEVNKEVLERVKKFFAAVPQPSTEYSAQDLERVQTDNEWLEKFAAGANSAAQVVKKLTLALSFRNILGVNYLTEYSFPLEIYKIGFVTPIGKDREGRHILLFRHNRWRKSPELYELMKKFIVYQFEKIDLIKPFLGFTIISDYTRVEQANIDRDMFDYITEMWETYARSNTLPLTVNLPEFMVSVKDEVTLGVDDKCYRKTNLLSLKN